MREDAGHQKRRGSRDKRQFLHVHHEHMGVGAGIPGDAASNHQKPSSHGSGVPRAGQHSLQSCCCTCRLDSSATCP